MFIDTIDEDSATGATAQYFAQQHARWGFLPNYARCFATRPDVAAAWGELAATISAGMPRRRFEIATIAAALARGSSYCAVAHSTFLRDACGDDATVRAIAADPTGGLLDASDRAVFAFATVVASAPATIGQADIDALLAVGLTDAEITDVVFAVSARTFFATVLDALGAGLDRATAATLDDDVLAALVVGRPPQGSG